MSDIEEYVYVICTKDLRCKIGRSIDPLARLEDIQACCPNKLEIVHLIHQKDSLLFCSKLEGKLHRHYKREGKHIHGEWFQLEESDLKEIESQWSNFLSEYQPRWPGPNRRFMTDEEYRIWLSSQEVKCDW